MPSRQMCTRSPGEEYNKITHAPCLRSKPDLFAGGELEETPSSGEDGVGDEQQVNGGFSVNPSCF